jgi:hypothetical protein
LGGVLNKTIKDCIQIALKRTALRIVKVMAASGYLYCVGRKSNDDEEDDDDAE